MVTEDFYAALRAQVQTFVRRFGLLENNVTPCGFPLSVSQVYAMEQLEKNATSITELASFLGLERSTVSRLVDDLVRGEFVIREVNPANRREVVLNLSDKGARSIKKVREQSVQFYRSVMSELSNEDKASILQGFKLFSESLAKVKGGGR